MKVRRRSCSVLFIFSNQNRNGWTNYSKNIKYANARKFDERMSRCSIQTDGQADVTKTVVDNRLARAPTIVLHA
jgi:hypothetical protein